MESRLLSEVLVAQGLDREMAETMVQNPNKYWAELAQAVDLAEIESENQQ